LPATLAVFRNDGGDYADKAKGMRATLTDGGAQAHSDDYHVGGALLLHLRRSFTLKSILCQAIGHRGPTKFKVHLVDHHHAHAASALHLSPWTDAALLTWDGIGSDGTSTFLGSSRTRSAPCTPA
jgi:carbamoyltransferase